MRVIVGARETLADAARRLRAHQASSAPVVSAGRPIGLITRALAENALRHGLAEAGVAELASGGAPRVTPAADLAAMTRAAIGIAPGLVVGGPRGPLQGVVTRHRLQEAIQRQASGPARAPWLQSRDLGTKMNARLGAELAAILKRAGGLASAQGVRLYLAGGVARDLLLGRVSKDLDLVVEGDGAGFAAELGRLLGARVTHHDVFGTAVIALPDGGRVDVASARRETYDAPSVLPRVTPGSMLDDLLRRDITINSMAIRLDGGLYGHLIDEVGGERDLRRRLARVNHMLSLVEDATRAYRIARFSARLGLTWSKESLGSLELAKRTRAFEALSGARLLREISLIGAEENPAAALQECARHGLLTFLGPGLTWNANTARIVTRLAGGEKLHPEAERVMLLLMTLSLRARPAHRAALVERLRITGVVAERLQSGPDDFRRLTHALAGSSKPSRIVRFCESATPELLALAWAAGAGKVRQAVERYLGGLKSVRTSVTGDTLKRLGLEPGPEYRAVLTALKQARLDGRIVDDASELKLAQSLVGRRRKRQR